MPWHRNEDWAQHVAACFASDYADARRRFVELCAKNGSPARAYVNPVRGPHGEELATDVAWFGNQDARHVAVLTSATHGVEGYCGSGCQMDWLLSGEASHLPEDCAVLRVHAVNPYGYAWLRRVTEDNVDLNRNGVDFNAPLPPNPGYAALRDAFVPAALSGPAFEAAQARLEDYRQRHGAQALVQARTMGQYIDAKGIHYGGNGPTWSRRTLEAVIRDYRLAERAQVAVVDYHTGLGPYGYGEPICGSRPGEPGQTRARAWYGASLTEPLLGTSTSVVIPGLMQYVWLREIGAAGITFIALEFGTYAPEVIEEAVIEENWLHARGQPDWNNAATQAIQRRLRHVYYPEQADWQELVLCRSRRIIRQTLDGLPRGVTRRE